MFNRFKLEELMNSKGWTAYRLCKEAKMAQSTLSDILNGKKKNPSSMTLSKLGSALGVSIDEFFKEEGQIENTVENSKRQIENTVKNQDLEDKIRYAEALTDFAEPEKALKFILSQPSMQDFGGYDLKNMSEEEILEIANDMLFAMRLSLEKMKKKDK